MLICTAANYKYYSSLYTLIMSITLLRSDDIEAIAVYDLGLSPKQREQLETFKLVSIHEVELTHPKLLTPIEENPEGRGYGVPGSRSWKPVVIKQALDLSPEILYLDAGHTILKPLDNLIEHIRQNGYFLYEVDHSIKAMTTKRMIDKFNLLRTDRQWILDPDTRGLQSNIIGLTRDSNIYNKFVMPLYELSKDIDLWVDDGTAPGMFYTDRLYDGPGKFGNCRTQAIFSIIACLNNMSILEHARPILKIKSTKSSISDYYRPVFIIGSKLPSDIFHQRGFSPRLFFLMYKKHKLLYFKYMFRHVPYLIKMYPTKRLINKMRLIKTYLIRYYRKLKRQS